MLTPAVQSKWGLKINPLWQWFGFIGAGLVAVIVSVINDRSRGLQTLFQPFLQCRVSIYYFVLVSFGVFLFYVATSWLCAVLNSAVSIRNWHELYHHTAGPFTHGHGLVMLMEITVIYAFREELGWRDFTLPQLLKKKPHYCHRDYRFF